MWQKCRAWFLRTVVDRPLPLGSKIGHYQICSVLGVGSYGIAYLVKHQLTEHRYVAKQVKPSLFSQEKGLSLQYYEKKVMDALQHPQIPRIIEHLVLKKKKQAFLIMDFIEGQTMEDMLFERKEKFREWDAAVLIRDIAKLVHFLHEQNIIHRDVRIPNVIMRENTPFLLDFGLARFLGDAPTYISPVMDHYPEEKQLRRKVEPSSDLYSLGHFFLFLLYSTFELNETAEENDLSWEEELSLSPEVHRMIRKLLQIDPPYETVEELLVDLDAYIDRKKAASSAAH